MKNIPKETVVQLRKEDVHIPEDEAESRKPMTSVTLCLLGVACFQTSGVCGIAHTCSMVGVNCGQ